MEFDKSKVYTALNADELKVGSKVLLSDRLSVLKRMVANDEKPQTLIAIGDENLIYRFISDTPEPIVDEFSLAYLVSPPAEPEYKPFTDTATAFKIITAHGGWLKGDGKTGKAHFFVTGFDIGCGDEDEIKIESVWLSTEYVFKHFVFADDDSPVGVKVEDTALEDHHVDK